MIKFDYNKRQISKSSERFLVFGFGLDLLFLRSLAPLVKEQRSKRKANQTLLTERSAMR
jgi:hypothetical protein